MAFEILRIRNFVQRTNQLDCEKVRNGRKCRTIIITYAVANFLHVSVQQTRKKKKKQSKLGGLKSLCAIKLNGRFS